MAANNMSLSRDEFPPRIDLLKLMAQNPLPLLAPGMVDPVSMADYEPTKQTQLVLDNLNTALARNDAGALEDCFWKDQAYWRDQLALTYHLRTFKSPGIIAASLLETNKLRAIKGDITVDGGAIFIQATPVLQFIDCGIAFQTSSPAATCKGKVILLPVKGANEIIEWKIWVLSTILKDLDIQKENETLLHSPGRQFGGIESFETEVFIIGGGNSAIALAARLKALGVESVMAERNVHAGDNWALRYDSMRFHVLTSLCHLPYMDYDQKLLTPHRLSKEDLASQVRQYVKAFNLNIITSAQIQWTEYDPSTKRWIVKFQTPAGQRKAISKHVILATGIASQKVNIPSIADSYLYKGTSIHSEQYKNAEQVKEKGAKSVIIIGSANTAFDILEDCHAAGLQVTMNVRSPTYIVPVDYVNNPASLGAYDASVELADNCFMTIPTVIDAQFARNLFSHFASQEPDRYKALAAAGFPVLDSNNPECALMQNLIERAGGHYVDVGGTKLLEEGKAGIKANVEPVAYTATGLRFSDGSHVEADAVIWCTGFVDKNVRETAAEILGGSPGQAPNGAEDDKNSVDGEADSKQKLGPRQIAARIDATWGVDSEGEIRGLWKRQSRLHGFWVMGGYTQQHRWHSRTLALQLKADLEGILPPAYLDTPTLTSEWV
ncbi:hypothetical protein DTO006G1_1649 [Penicillium roqueforti]|uniref:Uncharacterized protein n=1 Tax=Penicillium roqueforti (strain FM164) TaxID=1365484 RepID=W6QKT7_PENRF|nr:hypothetical protein CBS147337_6503 [Penicillium roqueforti]CDM36621.1 unnamed protein product [Penicillium roqueforti FM164]KAI2700909.1 hypothetical protein CBS147372_4979 [Penicillium roqueforti]KAI2727230.1 hypothetical protein CBS147354_3432 [Penicillium roqueforti]KAI2763308.1 hypothetical protein DTO006G1_1649 [Penicillium roqueforti]